jgi:hypothetical protein
MELNLTALKAWATGWISWLNQKRNVVFHSIYGSLGAIALLLDQLKLVDFSTLVSTSRAATVATVVAIGSIVLHFTDERVNKKDP